MKTIILIVLMVGGVICIMGMIYSVHMLLRNTKVHDFRIKLLYDDDVDFSKLDSYDEMMRSFKPLTKEHWVKD